MTRIVATIIVFLALQGCTSPNPAYCDSDSDCTDPAFPVCDTTIHGCVGTGAGNDGGPVADQQDESTGTDGDGPSESDGGQDGQQDQPIFVDDDNCPGPGSGTEEDPYCTIQQAIDDASKTGRPVTVMPGKYRENLRINGDVDITGSAGTEIETTSCPGILVMNHAEAKLSNLEIAGEGGVRVTADSTVSILECTIRGTACTGIDCQDSTCTVERTLIIDNEQGGINLSNSTYTIMNTMVVRNGQSGTFGGMQIRRPGAGSAISLVTIASNRTAGTNPAGVTCLTPAVIDSSIVWGNGEEPSNQVSGSCTLNWCDVDQNPSTLTGSNNISQDPQFIDEENGDFHIRTDSPCIDRANPAASAEEDFDGQARPQGSGPDIGADEAR
ncbi:MAG: hypothetical protein D6806_10215 [Deltaproteobacteria bacterium]|nr:MAG: hypothetical protein D6806_10215 [Deltaproteobacteria bacterium]